MATKDLGEVIGPKGDDGYSPSLSVASITGGHRVTLTNKSGSTTFDVMDGADGQDGADGTNGTNGTNGTDGYSPSISVEEITGGHKVTVTNATGSTSFNVMDGEDGEPGDPTELIDDTAGDGDTGKTWSADKLSEELSDVMSALNDKYTKPSGGIPGTDLADSYIEEPSSDGTNGQVLTTDGQGGRSWTTVQGGSGGVSDVQVNNVSVVTSGVANIPVGSASALGVVKVADTNTSGYAIYRNSNNQLEVIPATSAEIKSGTALRKPIAPLTQHEAVFYGLATAAGNTNQSSSGNAVGNYTVDALSKISNMLNAPVSVSGSTPSITAKSGVRYVCGECSTLTIVVPASGCIDVVFESGSTATVLTVTPPTGVTAVKWAGGFDPTSLDANATYELNILDGEWGAAGKWT